MTAIQTVSGHVSQALNFLSKSDVWMCLSHPFQWDVSRLTGIEVENFVFSDADDLEFIFEVNGVEVVAPFVEDASYTAAALATYLQGLALAEGLPANTVTATSDKRIRITAALPESGYGTVRVTRGNDIIGLLTGEESIGVEAGAEIDPPPPDPLTRRLLEPFGWEKVDQLTKALVVPDPATAASITGTNRAYNFNLSGVDQDLLTFLVDDNPTPIEVTFPAGNNVSLGSIVSYINAAALAVSPDYGVVAQMDGSSLPPALKLVSPTKGALSKLEITVGNNALGIPPVAPGPPTVVTGLAGGAVRFRNDNFRVVDEEDAYDEGAVMVFVQARFPYDQVPLLPYAQIGVLSGIVPKTGYEARTYLVFSEVEEFGILEFLDNRKLTPREIDSAQLISLVIEF